MDQPIPTGLVVDDEPEVRRLFATVLRRASIRVFEAESGDAALALLETARPDFVVTDVEMPGISGVELCRQLRSHAAFEKVVIVVVSGAAGAAGHEAIAAGCDAVLPKPCPPRVLLSTIERLLAR